MFERTKLNIRVDDGLYSPFGAAMCSFCCRRAGGMLKTRRQHAKRKERRGEGGNSMLTKCKHATLRENKERKRLFSIIES